LIILANIKYLVCNWIKKIRSFEFQVNINNLSILNSELISVIDIHFLSRSIDKSTDYA